MCAGGWGAHRDAGDTRARVRRAVGSRAAPLCVLSLFRLQTGSTERSLGVLLLVFDSEFPTVNGTVLYLGLPSKDSLNVFKFHRVWFHRSFRSLRTSSHVLLRTVAGHQTSLIFACGDEERRGGEAACAVRASKRTNSQLYASPLWINWGGVTGNCRYYVTIVFR